MRCPASWHGAWRLLALAVSLGCDGGAPGGPGGTGLDALPDAPPVDGGAEPADGDAEEAAVTDGGPADCGSSGGCADAAQCDRQDADGDCFEALCAEDAECPEDAWCDDGACVPGCRFEPDDCDATPAGVLRRCGADRTCVELLPCCGADNRCRAVPEAECDGQVLRAVPTCREGGAFAGDDPCSVGGDARCAADDDCDWPFYCHPVDQRCYPGCRVGVPGTCHPWQVCTRDRECAVQPCAVDAECPDAYYCDVERGPSCRPGCRDDDGCRAFERCDRTLHRCFDPEEACTPWRCPEGTSCGVGFLGCVPIAEACQSDDNCTPDQVCDLETGLCEFGCRDDAFEGEDSFDDPPRVALGPRDADGGRRGAVGPRVVCPGTSDFFSVTLAPNERMRVSVVTMCAFDCPEVRLHSAAVPGGPLHFADPWAPMGFDYPPVGGALPFEATFVIEVIGLGEVAEAFEVDIRTTVTGCFADGGEPNDAPDDAGWVFSPRSVLRARSLCGADEDWFCADLETNDGLELTLTATPDSAPVAIESYALSHAQAAGGLDEPAYGRDDVSVEMTPDGTVYRFARAPWTASFDDEPWCTRVRLVEGGAAADYEAVFSITRSDAWCEATPNDTAATAVVLDAIPGLSIDGMLIPDEDLAVDEDGILCPRDVDVYCLGADEGDTVQAWVVSDGLVGDVIVQLYAPDGLPLGPEVAPTRPGEPPQPAEARDAQAGRYCVSVDGVGPAQGPYDLFVRRSPRAVP